MHTCTHKHVYPRSYEHSQREAHILHIHINISNKVALLLLLMPSQRTKIACGVDALCSEEEWNKEKEMFAHLCVTTESWKAQILKREFYNLENKI